MSIRIFVIGLLIIFVALFSCGGGGHKPEKDIAQLLLIQVDSFERTCAQMETVAEKGGTDSTLQSLFLRARLEYKRFEWAAEYFVPATTRFVNGPPVEEIEPSGQVFEPAGLQVVESLLFPQLQGRQSSEFAAQLGLLRENCKKYHSYFANIDLLDWQVFDAAKLEVFRIETLGISGFDNPVTLHSMEESAAALSSLKSVLQLYGSKGETDRLRKNMDDANSYLANHIDFGAFDRAEFIRTFCDPITREISEFEARLNIHVIRYNRLLNQDAKTLFDTNAFNVNAYVPNYNSFASRQKILLGKKLFSDPMLSGTGTRSCQSCHQPERAFSDGLAKNTIIEDHRLLKRNTPTLINAALQPAVFYDLRVRTLEDQSRSVVQSEAEMHGSLSLAVGRIWRDSTYRRLFSEAFPRKARSGIDTLEVMNAIGSYVRSLTSLNSRFDAYMRGEDAALTEEELKGFNLFMGKAKCGTCHYMPLFNGTFPPRFMKNESEVIGVPKEIRRTAEGKMLAHRLDDDLGRYDVIRVASLKHAFKTPTVRNIARTAPYMHNGAFNSLEDVVEFYIEGGGTGLGLDVPNQTLPFDKLDLSDKERAQVVAFLKTLDSR